MICLFKIHIRLHSTLVSTAARAKQYGIERIGKFRFVSHHSRSPARRDATQQQLCAPMQATRPRIAYISVNRWFETLIVDDMRKV